MGESRPSFVQALRFWWLLGWISFGGPAGQIALMHAELVERRRWVDEGTFLHGLNYCMLLPGPEAMQLATYLGWRLHGLRGGIVAGTLFVLPGALLIAALSALYVTLGEVPAVVGLLLGLQAAVLGILVHAVLRIGKRVLKTMVAAAIAVLALIAVAMTVPFPMIVGVAALLGLIAARWLPTNAAHADGADAAVAATGANGGIVRALRIAVACVLLWWGPLLAVAALLGTQSTAFAQGLFFSKAALVTFGGAYAVLPYVAQQAVETHRWLSAEQMLVGLGLAETTPGPLILVLEFVGFLGGWLQGDLASPWLSALLGAAVTLWATFLPCFLFVLPVAPWIERLRDWPTASAALSGITAAVVGVIAHLALWFGASLLAEGDAMQRALVAALALASFVALAWRNASVIRLVLACAIAGAVAGALAP